MTFNQLVPVYIERYVKGYDLASADTIEYRMVPLLDRFGSQRLSEIKQGDIEEFIADLRQPSIVSEGQTTVRARKPATINRYISLLRHMFSWAIDHELLDQSPMRRIRQLREDNRRHRRILPDEEQGLLEAAAPHLCLMIIFALDTGMRRAEMLWLRWDDLEARQVGSECEVRQPNPAGPSGCRLALCGCRRCWISFAWTLQDIQSRVMPLCSATRLVNQLGSSALRGRWRSSEPMA